MSIKFPTLLDWCLAVDDTRRTSSENDSEDFHHASEACDILVVKHVNVG